MYPAFLSNSGIINSYEVVGVKKGPVKIQSDLDYKGEAYLLEAQGHALISYFSPNEIKINADIREDGILVLNQNYHKGWKVLKQNIKSPAVSYGGLIATKVAPEDKTVTFYYFPDLFVIGSLISLVSFVVVAIFIFI